MPSTSSTSAPRRAAPKRLECPNHDERVLCEPAVVYLTFPRGRLPVEGQRCPQCGEELLAGGAMTRANEEAQRLGLYGPENVKVRKLIRVGGSIAVTLDPKQLDALHVHVGDVVEVALEGDKIVLRPDSPDTEPVGPPRPRVDEGRAVKMKTPDDVKREVDRVRSRAKDG